jgi:hypothetical protein
MLDLTRRQYLIGVGTIAGAACLGVLHEKTEFFQPLSDSLSEETIDTSDEQLHRDQTDR